MYVLADGVSSCNREEIPIAFERIRQAGGKVTTSESLLYEIIGRSKFHSVVAQLAHLIEIFIEGDASRPNFKPFAGFIKESASENKKTLNALLGSINNT